jgi:hypothetical protein
MLAMTQGINKQDRARIICDKAINRELARIART